MYFAWVRERIGKTDEDITPPPAARTVGDIIGWLATLGENYAHAFEHPKTIRAALDRTHARHDAPIAGATEIAFFPPDDGRLTHVPGSRAVGTLRFRHRDAEPA